MVGGWRLLDRVRCYFGRQIDRVLCLRAIYRGRRLRLVLLELELGVVGVVLLVMEEEKEVRTLTWRLNVDPIWLESPQKVLQHHLDVDWLKLQFWDLPYYAFSWEC